MQGECAEICDWTLVTNGWLSEPGAICMVAHDASPCILCSFDTFNNKKGKNYKNTFEGTLTGLRWNSLCIKKEWWSLVKIHQISKIHESLLILKVLLPLEVARAPIHYMKNWRKEKNQEFILLFIYKLHSRIWQPWRYNSQNSPQESTCHFVVRNTVNCPSSG